MSQLIHCKPVVICLTLCKLFGIFPFELKVQKNVNYFKVNRGLIFLTVLYEVGLLIYSGLTIYCGVAQANKSYDFYDYIHLFGTLQESVETHSIIIGIILFSTRIAKLLEKVFLHSTNNLKIISKQISISMAIMAFLYAVYCARVAIVMWIYDNQTIVFSLKKFADSKVAVTIRTILNIYRDLQLILVFIICFVTANMFQEIAETLKESLNKIISIQKSDQTHTVNKNGSIHTKAHYDFFSSHLAIQNQKFRIAVECMQEVNYCFGFQLFNILSSDLYMMIFFIFRQFAHIYSHLFIRNIIGALAQFGRLLIILLIGNFIKNKSQAPLQTLQQTDLVYLPINLQIKIQSVFSQWSTTGASYLTAFNLLKIDPTLLGPIITNFITYLMIFLQYDKEAPTYEVKPLS